MYDFLDKTQEPYILKTNLTADEFLKQMVNIYGGKIKNSFFILDGNNMKNAKELFTEFQNVMKFPDYFGHNFDALDECLSDLYEWLYVDEYILFIKNSNNILIDINKDKHHILIEILSSVAKELSSPIKYEDSNNVNNRKAYPFHVILS